MDLLGLLWEKWSKTDKNYLAIESAVRLNVMTSKYLPLVLFNSVLFSPPPSDNLN